MDREPWDEFAHQIGSLSARIQSHYEALVDHDGAPSREEVGEALATLGRAARALIGSLQRAAGEPETMRELHRLGAVTASAILGALASLVEPDDGPEGI